MGIKDKKNIFIIIGILVLSILVTLLVQVQLMFGVSNLTNCHKYVFRGKYSKQLEYNKEHINQYLKDIVIDEENYISVSDDPWIMLEDINEPIFVVDIYMKQVAKDMNCTIYYTDENHTFSEERTARTSLKVGRNTIYIPSIKKIDKLRIDITSRAKDRFDIQDIRVNDQEILKIYHSDRLLGIFIITLIICVFILYLIRRKDTYNIILLIGSVIIVVYNLVHMKDMTSITNKMILIIISCSLACIIGYLIKGKINIVKQFIVIVALVGISFSIIIPPMQAPDEDVHWIRSYYMATGHISVPNKMKNIPVSFNKYLEDIGSFDMPFNYNVKVNKKAFKELLSQSLNKQEVVEYDKGSRTDNYLTFAYLPQSIGMAIGNIFNLPPFWILLLGRITNLAIWCAICSYALYIMPIKKQLLLAIMLMPMSVFQASSLSPDATLNASSFLLIAYILHLKYRRENITLKDYMILIACSIGIVSVKNPYLILLGLMLMIPKERFSNNSRAQGFTKIISIIGIGIIGLVAYVGIKLMIIEVASVGGNNANAISVLKDTMCNLLIFIKLVFSNLRINLGYYYQTMVARFGWLDTPMSLHIIRLYVLSVVVIALIPDGKEEKLEVKDKLWMLCLFCGFIVMLIMVGVLWAESDWKELTAVGGIQGRYFIPFIILIPLGLYNIKLMNFMNKIKDFLMKNMYVNILVAILIVSIDCIIYRYWLS